MEADGGSEALGTLLLVDTAGCGMDEAAEPDSDSKRNEGEAAATLAHAQRLVSAGVRPQDIGVITPYNAQVCAPEEGSRAYDAHHAAALLLTLSSVKAENIMAV